MAERVSIAMCTYNGGKHLGEQLASFARQTRLPDELIVCDDGSQDETASIVESFSSTAPFAVKFVRNETNLGFARNFTKAASLCSGDIIFFSDQDDVWLDEKLAKMLASFAGDESVGLVFCNADLVDAGLVSRNLTYWQKQNFTEDLQRKMTSDIGARLLLRDPAQMAAGATMAYSARFASSIFPLPTGWTHDAWIATLVAAQSRVALIEEPLNLYRQHEAQVYGASSTAATRRQYAKQRAASAQHFIDTAQRYEALHDRLAGVTTLDSRFPAHVAAKVAHWNARAKMRSSWRIARAPAVAWELITGHYARYAQGLRSAAMDTLF